jgi:hypothetical protein
MVASNETNNQSVYELVPDHATEATEEEEEVLIIADDDAEPNEAEPDEELEDERCDCCARSWEDCSCWCSRCGDRYNLCRYSC